MHTDFAENFMGLTEAIKAGPGLYPEDVGNAVMYCLGTPPHVQVNKTLKYNEMEVIYPLRLFYIMLET